MLLLSTPCNVHTWKSEDMSEIDIRVGKECDHILNLEWGKYGMQADGIHFTEDGQEAFQNDLVAEMSKAISLRAKEEDALHAVYVVTDSTVGHQDFSESGEWTGGASKALERKIRESTGASVVHVDAACGSGYVAGHLFRRRVQRIVTRHKEEEGGDKPAAMLIMGGWNDEGKPRMTLCHAIEGCFKEARGGWKRRRGGF